MNKIEKEMKQIRKEIDEYHPDKNGKSRRKLENLGMGFKAHDNKNPKLIYQVMKKGVYEGYWKAFQLGNRFYPLKFTKKSDINPLVLHYFYNEEWDKKIAFEKEKYGSKSYDVTNCTTLDIPIIKSKNLSRFKIEELEAVRLIEKMD